MEMELYFKMKIKQPWEDDLEIEKILKESGFIHILSNTGTGDVVELWLKHNSLFSS